MRKYLRRKAKRAMEKAGIQHMNKRAIVVNPKTHVPEKADSFFSQNWHAYC